MSLVRLKPLDYVHVLNSTSNVTEVFVGPCTITLEDQQRVVTEGRCVVVPPSSYVVVHNPVKRDAAGEPLRDADGAYVNAHGDAEVRLHSPPWPLYPAEELSSEGVQPLRIVEANQALRLVVRRDYDEHKAGDELLFHGPGVYTPRVEVDVTETMSDVILKEGQALKLRARQAFTDRRGVKRNDGEEWLWRDAGAYMPSVYESVVTVLEAHVLTATRAIHLRALRNFKCSLLGKERLAGDEYLVTAAEAASFVADVHEEVVGTVPLQTLTAMQFCVVLDPVDAATNKPRLGEREVRRGPRSFFLLPFERLANGIERVYVLSENDALLLRATEAVKEKGKTVREAGELWMIQGPCDFVPSVEVAVVEQRRALLLEAHEGVYVRDTTSGVVRLVSGEAYMLKPNEALFEKVVSPEVEALLATQSGDVSLLRPMEAAETDAAAATTAAAARKRDPTRAITLRVPHNAATQLFDSTAKTSRIVLGPQMVMLKPSEDVTVLSLSGSTPKRPHVIKTLILFLGPEYFTDVFTVETIEHCRLRLKLSFMWHFDVDAADLAKIFSVADFVGDAAKSMASRIRGAVAQTMFDAFHKGSSEIIRRAVFGDKERFVFPANGLVITGIDIQEVEPIDDETRRSLSRAVSLAIEISTKSLEANARHEAATAAQNASGALERLKLADEAEAEAAKTRLLKLKSETTTVEATGKATAEARALAEAAAIESASELETAELEAKRQSTLAAATLEIERQQQEAALAHRAALDALAVARAERLAAIESTKLKAMVKAITPEALVAMSRAGEESKIQMLQALGLKSALFTDGNSPISLFETAEGLIKQ